MKKKTSSNSFSEIINFIKALYPNENPVPLHAPRFIGNEKKYVVDAIDSTFVSSVGKYVDRFEEMICEITGAQHTIATVNGTCALHIALKLAGVQPGDEVITQPLSFVATANSIAHCGANPIFLDVERETLGLDPTALKSFLQAHAHIRENTCCNKTTDNRIAACVPMHTFGHPCRIDEIAEICNHYHIPLVEDSAESLGSLYKGKHTGTFGQFGVYSFNGNKTVTCGGGGAIATNDETLAKKAKHITTTAKLLHPYEYVHNMIAYNYRLPNLNAALACAQLEQLNTFVENKRELARPYQEYFESLDIPFIKEPEHARSNYWLNAIIMPDRKTRDEFLKATNEAGVMTRPIWRLLNKLEMYKDCQTDVLENARWLEDRVVNIPSSVIGVSGERAAKCIAKKHPQKIKIGYFADGPWAHEAFKRLIADKNIEIRFICTRYDSEGNTLIELGRQYQIPYIRHKNINSKEFIEQAKGFNCDLFVSMSFNQIFKRGIINLPPLKTINCHAGKLPFYRGRNILNWALINDEKEVGITVHYTDEGIDTGDIILQRIFPITDNDDYGTLLETAYVECAKILYDSIKLIQSNELIPIPQSEIHPEGMYCGQRREGDETVNWSQTSREIFNFIRAICKPGPMARSFIADKEMKINKASIIEKAPSYKGIIGSVIGIEKDGFLVKTLDSFIKITEWECERKIRIGDRFQY